MDSEKSCIIKASKGLTDVMVKKFLLFRIGSKTQQRHIGRKRN